MDRQWSGQGRPGQPGPNSSVDVQPNRGNPGGFGQVGNRNPDGNWRGGDRNGNNGGNGPDGGGRRPGGAGFQDRGPNAGSNPGRVDAYRGNNGNFRPGVGRPQNGAGWQNQGGYAGNWQNGGRLNSNERWQGQQRWSNDWRRDNRYNWSGYRQSNRSTYRMPTYRPPSGWGYGYSRFSIGLFLGGPLYSNSYWIDDPYSYRLPPAYGTLRWVRYYDDALLVDIRDGYVVDVIHDFFW